MTIHKKATLTPIGRERLARRIESGLTPQVLAKAAGVCPRSVRKWLARRLVPMGWRGLRIARCVRIGFPGGRAN